MFKPIKAISIIDVCNELLFRAPPLCSSYAFEEENEWKYLGIIHYLIKQIKLKRKKKHIQCRKVNLVNCGYSRNYV